MKKDHLIYKKKEMLDALKEINLCLISLHKIGSFYVDMPVEEYANETNKFIDEWKVTNRLALVRSILSKPFDTSLGDDDMEELEREMASIVYWEKPGDMPDVFGFERDA